MQEIKFRAWDRITKKYWNIESWHFEDGYLDLVELGASNADPNTQVLSRKEEDVEIMQYTGLDDSNGKPIFNGDIVDVDIQSYDLGFYYEVGYTCLVKWYHGAYYFDVIKHEVLQEEGAVAIKEIIEFDMITEEDVDVIGNRFENKELLEG